MWGPSSGVPPPCLHLKGPFDSWIGDKQSLMFNLQLSMLFNAVLALCGGLSFFHIVSGALSVRKLKPGQSPHVW